MSEWTGAMAYWSWIVLGYKFWGGHNSTEVWVRLDYKLGQVEAGLDHTWQNGKKDWEGPVRHDQVQTLRKDPYWRMATTDFINYYPSF